MYRFRLIVFACLCVLLSVVGETGLRAQIVTNGSFATPVQGSGSFEYNPSSASATWTFTGRSGISASDGPWAPVGGASSQFAFLQIYDDGTNSFAQTVSFTTSGTFTLSYLLGTRADYPGISYNVSLTNNSNSTVVFSTNDSSSSGQEFTSVNYTVTVPTTGNYTLKFESISGGDFTDRSAVFDNIAFTSAVPEPATTAAWLGAGALAFVGWRRRRRA